MKQKAVEVHHVKAAIITNRINEIETSGTFRRVWSQLRPAVSVQAVIIFIYFRHKVHSKHTHIKYIKQTCHRDSQIEREGREY